MTQKKAIIYDPYLDTLGGGERYCLTVGEILLNAGYQVDLFWSGDQSILATAENRFSLKLSGINLKPDIFGLVPQKIDLTEDNLDPQKVFASSRSHSNIITNLKTFLKKYRTLSSYDLCFFLSDGSIPFLFSKMNLLHIQVPFATRSSIKTKIINYLKSGLIKSVITNSSFTASFVDDTFKSKISILYPPVSVEQFSSSTNKKNVILSVGRFDNILNSKKQDVLIEAFKKFLSNNPGTDWQLCLAGASRLPETENHYLLHLKSLAAGLPIHFVINPNFTELKELYSESKIYWHAAGYQVDELTHPEQTEHFGITPVEAMSSGCVPFLVNRGGLKEIVVDGQNGYLWNDLSELIAKTQLLTSTPQEFKKIQQVALATSSSFSRKVFEEKFLKII